MEKEEFLTRLHALECEIDELKSEMQPPKKQNRFLASCQKGLQFVKSNWFLVGIIAAIIGFAVYQVNPLQDFQNIKTKRDLAEFYRKEGDTLIERSYYEAAAKAFQTAIDIDPNNIEATYGIAKVQILMPGEGQRFVPPAVMDAQLDYLTSLPSFSNDYLLDYLRGQQYFAESNYETAKTWFANSVVKNTNFVPGYLALGSVSQYGLNSKAIVEEAIGYYQKAIAIDLENPDAHNNLGYMYILLGDFVPAFDELQKASDLFPSFDTLLGLGDVYNYLEDPYHALQMHQWISSVIDDPDTDKNDPFLNGTVLYNFSPKLWKTQNDVTQANLDRDYITIASFAEAGAVWQKRILLYYALSLDYALNGDLEQADAAFEKAHQLDLSHQYSGLIDSKMTSLESYLSLERDTQFWFDAHRIQLWT